MLRTVAVIVQEPVAVFELGVVAEVFGVDRTDDGVPSFDYRVCALRPGRPLAAGPATSVTAADPLTATDDADLVAVVCSSATESPPAPVLAAIARAHDRGALLLAVCTGVFALAHAGVLDGRRVATHWRHADELAALRPQVQVDADILYFRDGPVVSCAGTAAGIDACLHLVRAELGSAVANRIARRMVIRAHRSGSQQQRPSVPVVPPPGRSLQPVLEWLEDRLDQPVAGREVAAAAHLSERTLLRRFAEQIGTTPHEWLTQRRVARAQELLSHSSLSVDEVARLSGFVSPHLLRHHLRRLTGETPTQFRRRVANDPPGAATGS